LQPVQPEENLEKSYSKRKVESSSSIVQSWTVSIWLYSWTKARMFWWCSCTSLTAICRLRWRGRSGLTYNSVWSVQLLLIGTNQLWGTIFLWNWKTGTSVGSASNYAQNMAFW